MKFFEMFEEGLDDMKQHSPLILAGIACLGVVATAAISIHAGKKLKLKDDIVKQKIEEKKQAGEVVTRKDSLVLHVREKWPAIVPVVAVGAVTITSMIFSYKISAKRIATLTTALAVTTKAFDGYKQAAEKLLGEKEKEIQREKLKNEVNQNPPSKELTDKVDADNKKLQEEYEKSKARGDTNAVFNTVQVWYEPVTNQYFKAQESEIVKAFEQVANKLQSGMYDEVTVNDLLYDIDDADASMPAGNVFMWTQKRFPKGPKYDLREGVKAPNGVFVGKISYDVGTGIDGMDTDWM